MVYIKSFEPLDIFLNINKVTPIDIPIKITLERNNELSLKPDLFSIVIGIKSYLFCV
jgi:hypothetical protein